MRLILGSFPHPITISPRLLHSPSLSTTEFKLNAPLPSPGMWAGSFGLAEGIWEGGSPGGTQEVGGPGSASRKRATMKLVAHFRHFHFHNPTDHPSSQHNVDRRRCQRHVELPCVQERAGGQILPPSSTFLAWQHAEGPNATWRAQTRRGGPKRDVEGPNATRRAQTRCGGPKRDVGAPNATWKAQTRRGGPEHNAECLTVKAA